MPARRSSWTGTGGGAVVVVIWCVSWVRAGGAAGRGRGRPPGSLLAGALPGELLDGRGVGLVDEARAGEDRLAAADGVRVGLVELQEHDRQVPLEVLLLVDGEQDVAALDVLEERRAEVERRQLRIRARTLDRRLGGGRDVRVQRDDGVERLVGLELGLDLGLGRGDVGRALDLEVGHGAAEALLDTVAALLQADVVLLVDDAEHLLGARVLELGARRLAGDRLRLADVGDRAELLEVLGARVQRDDRDAGGLGLGQRALDRIDVGNRDREAVDLLRDGGVDELGLLLRVVVRRAPDQLDALVLGRLLGALLDDRPERPLVAVGDHGERQPAALGQVDLLTGPAAARGGGAAVVGGVVVVVVAAAAARGDERAEHQQRSQQAANQALHVWVTSLLGAQVDRNSMLLRTSSAGPPSAGGSGPVMATSCSSTSQRSYPASTRRRTTSSIPASPSPSGRNRPSCVAWTSVSSPRPTLPASGAFTSLRWTWPMRSACWR